MTNKNYIRGYNIERKALKELEKEGFFSIRSAGSHSKFDIVAINKNEIRLIQLKSVRTKYYSFKKEIEELKKFNNYPKNTTIELWVWLSRIKGIRKAQWQKTIVK